jgi:hypothetical protein
MKKILLVLLLTITSCEAYLTDDPSTVIGIEKKKAKKEDKLKALQ